MTWRRPRLEFYQWLADADIARFDKVMARLVSPTEYEYTQPPTTTADYWCERCRAGDHHAAVPVGPYMICRCLGCPEVALD